MLNAYLLLNIPASILPDQEIITFGQKRQSYGQLLEETGRLAAALKAYGVGPGDRVGLVSTNCPEMVAAFFAAFQLGAVIVPINYRAKADELAYMIQDAEAKVLFIENRYMDIMSPLLEECGVQSCISLGGEQGTGTNYEEILNKFEQPEIDFADVNESDLAILLYTSGTTSRPKGVMITHGQLTGYVMNHSEAADGTPKGASIICAPSYHIAGATSICNCIYGGRRLIIMRQFRADEWLDFVESEQATHAFLVPTMLKQIIDHPQFDTKDLSSLQSLSYGAAPMPFPVIRRAVDLFPPQTQFANAFGMTETTSTVCVLGPDDHNLTGTPDEVEKKTRRLSSVGLPLPGVEIMITDDNGKKVEANTLGHVYVRTGRSMKGYWKKPEASNETLVDGWVNTKDMGWLDEDGYLFLNGRSSDLIIRGGENISPAEIENVLLGHPEVSDVAVIGNPSLDWGEEVLAIIVPKDLANPPAKDEIQQYCRGHLASFKRPAKIEYTNDLPRTSTGKILKRTLREQYNPDSVSHP